MAYDNLKYGDKPTYNDFKQELASYYKSKRRQKTFIRRFDDYMGNRNALKDYIKEEVFGMFIFSLIFLNIVSIFISHCHNHLDTCCCLYTCISKYKLQNRNIYMS